MGAADRHHRRVFRNLGKPTHRRRLVDDTDGADTQPVVVVNETLQRRYFPDGSAVGQRFKLSSDIDVVYRRIVGVVADTQHDGLDAEVRPEMYLPYSQFPATADFVVGTMSLVVRTSGDPLSLAAEIRDTVRGIDADVPVSWVASMEEVVTASTSIERLNVALFGFFGVLALALVSVGVYGVIASLVTERLREVGIRMALGARPRTVLLLVLGRGLALALAGIAIGVAGTLGVGRALSGMLYGVSWYDPITLVSIPVLVLVVALLACYFPARRAMRVDPVEVLRYQ